MSDASSSPPFPPAPEQPLTAYGLEGEDARIVVAIVSNLPILAFSIVAYVMLHKFCNHMMFRNYHHGTRRRVAREGPEPPPGYCGWFRVVLKMSPVQYDKATGLDAVVFLEYLRIPIQMV